MSYNILITSIGGIRGRDLSLKLKESLKDTKILQVMQFFKRIWNIFLMVLFYLKIQKTKKYISHLLKVIKENKIKLVILGSDEEAILMSKFKREIKKKTKVATDDYKILKHFKDKYSTYEKLTKWTLQNMEKLKF